MSAVFAVQQIAHGFAASGIGALIGLQGVAGSLCYRFLFTAVGTTVGESRLARFEFKFFATNHAGF